MYSAVPLSDSCGSLSKAHPPYIRRPSQTLIVSKRLRVCASFLLTLLAAVLALRLRHSSQVSSVSYPVTDDALLQLIEEDLSVWDEQQRRRRRTRNSNRPQYHIPGPDVLRTICRECTVVHIDTTSSNRKGPMVRFLNEEFDHLRLLWYGCSLNRAAAKLRREGIKVDAYFVINVGDFYIEQDKADFPIWSKARPTKVASSSGDASSSEAVPGTRDIMYPYEELLWSYPADDLVVPFDKKSASVAYRGGCTHPRRADMVDVVREAFPPPKSDVAVSCRSAFRPLSPEEQGKYRCLLDYDGHGYSRRMAWYLQTGSVVLRGGVIDDVLSRLARNQDSQAKTKVPPVIFWVWGSNGDENADGNSTSKSKVSVKDNSKSDGLGLLSSVRSCLTNDTYATEMSASGLNFWSQYVEKGQQVWDGYIAHLLVRQSRLLKLILDQSEYLESNRHSSGKAMGWTHRFPLRRAPLFLSLSESDVVCSAVFDIVTPTGQYGRPRWKFIFFSICYCLAMFTVCYMIAIPACKESIKRTVKRNCACTDRSTASGATMFGRIAVSLGFVVRDE